MSQTASRRGEQVKEFTKRIVINAVKNVLPIAGPAQFALDVAQDFYDVFISASSEDRESLMAAARALSEPERASFIAELEQSGGPEAGVAARGVLETLRAAPSQAQLRQSVNTHLLGGRGFSPRPLTPQQRAVGAAVASSLMAPPSLIRAARAPHPSSWPEVEGYELKGFLGAGAFAQVFLARELDASGTPQRSCALKVGDLHDRGRFRREVRALEAVSHPNVIDFYGAGVIETPPPPRFWIAMPNLSGLTLGDLMRQGLDDEQKLLLALQVLSGLEALHASGVSHRDLKPENALISDGFEVKLTDFGLSKDDGGVSGQSLATMQGEMMGTPAYMSPEQADGKPSGPEADVWSFGVLVFELFTGELLFQNHEGESVARVFSNVLNKPIKLDHPQLPTELASVLKHCINRDLSSRFSDAGSLAQYFRLAAEKVRRRMRHARYRGTWTALIEGEWIERFARDLKGQLPDNAVTEFVSRYPEASAVDPERLAEVLPVVFAAQREMESLRGQRQNVDVDWEAELRQAESSAVASLGLSTVEEAIARASEVESLKREARASVERRYAEFSRQEQGLAESIRSAEEGVRRALREALRDELSDYDQLMAERARAEQAERERRVAERAWAEQAERARAEQAERDRRVAEALAWKEWEEAERLKAARRRKVMGVVVIVAVLLVGLIVWRVDVARQEVERERQEAVARAEQEERERQEAVARAEQEERERQEAVARARYVNEDKSGLTWVKIPAGSFAMGSNDGANDEKPIHTVQVSSFMMAESEVTVAQYRKCVEAGVCTEPGTGGYKNACTWGKSGYDDHPINCVDWGQARTFSRWVGGDLPTEAQWEYAARGGEGFKYAGSDDPYEVAWYIKTTNDTGTREVKTKKRNGYGLYDMSGNVWEWTLDEWHGSYSGAPSSGDQPWGDTPICRQVCDSESSGRVNRGGSWRSDVGPLRVAIRYDSAPGNRDDNLGFRPAGPIP